MRCRSAVLFKHTDPLPQHHFKQKVSKKRILVPRQKRGIFDKIKAAARFPALGDFPTGSSLKWGSQPGGTLQHIEDLNRVPNAEVGP
jgi:hypothetical protein